jgi:hypothetical protein
MTVGRQSLRHRRTINWGRGAGGNRGKVSMMEGDGILEHFIQVDASHQAHMRVRVHAVIILATEHRSEGREAHGHGVHLAQVRDVRGGRSGARVARDHHNLAGCGVMRQRRRRPKVARHRRCSGLPRPPPREHERLQRSGGANVL